MELKKKILIRQRIDYWFDEDISTEFMLSIICDECRCEIEDVIEVMMDLNDN